MGKIDAHKTSNFNYYDEGVRIIELANSAYTRFKSQPAEEKRKILKLVLSNCYLEDKKLRPEYKKPFDIIFKNRNCPSWLPDLDSNQDSQNQNLMAYH